jgi:hypothetical protein
MSSGRERRPAAAAAAAAAADAADVLKRGERSWSCADACVDETRA